MKTFDEIFALATSPLHREYAETFTDPRLSWGVGVTQGVTVAMQEAQAEIDALKAENKRLQEKSEHLTIARFNWRTKYVTLATSALLILGLDESTSRDEIINAVDALKAQRDELLGVLQMVADGCGVLDISERGQLYEAIAKARGDL